MFDVLIGVTSDGYEVHLEGKIYQITNYFDDDDLEDLKQLIITLSEGNANVLIEEMY